MRCRTLRALVNAACLPAGSVHSVVIIDNGESQLCSECLPCNALWSGHCCRCLLLDTWLFVLTSITTGLDCNMYTHAMLTSRNLALLNSCVALQLENDAATSAASLLRHWGWPVEVESWSLALTWWPIQLPEPQDLLAETESERTLVGTRICS